MARLEVASRANLLELCLTGREAAALSQVAASLHGQGHADAAASLLTGLLVRFKRQGVYQLAPVASLGLPPAVPQPTLVLQGFADLTLDKLSGTNPFVSDATYEATGRHEAARLAAATAAAGGLDLWQSAAAVWRKKVALGWAPQLQHLMAMHGIGRLCHDLEDVTMIDAVAGNLDALPPAPAVEPHLPPHLFPQQQQPPAQQEPMQQQPPVQQQQQAPAQQVPMQQPPVQQQPALQHPMQAPPPQQPMQQQAAAAHDPDELPPHLRHHAQPAAQQALQQHMLPAQQPGAGLQPDRHLWPVVQQQPVPPPPLAEQRQQRVAEEEAPTPVLSDISGAVAAAWDAAMVAEQQPLGDAQQAVPTAQQAAPEPAAPEPQPPAEPAAPAQQPPAEQAAPVPQPPAEQAAPVPQPQAQQPPAGQPPAEQAAPVPQPQAQQPPAGQPPAEQAAAVPQPPAEVLEEGHSVQLEEAQSLLLQLLEQQQAQPPPPQQQQQQQPGLPPPQELQQEPAELPQRAPWPQQQQQQQSAAAQHVQQEPGQHVQQEPGQHAEPLVTRQPNGQGPPAQQPVNQEVAYDQEQSEQPLPAAQVLPRSTSELPRHAQQLPPGLQASGMPSAQQQPPGLQANAPPPAQQLPPGLQQREQSPQAGSHVAQQQQQQQQPPGLHQPQPQPQQGGQEWPVLVCNLGDAFTAEQLAHYFRLRYPSVTSAAIPRLERTGEPKGFGFVRFAQREEQLRAAREMDGHVLPGGRKIGTGLAGPGGGPPAAAPAPVPVPAAVPSGGIAQQQAAAAAAVRSQKEATGSPAGSPRQQPQQKPKQQQPMQQGNAGRLQRSSSHDKPPPLQASRGVANDTAAAGGPSAAGGAPPAGPMPGPAAAAAAAQAALLGRQPSFPAASAGAGGPQAMLPLVWPGGMFGPSGFMPLMMQPGGLCYPGMRPGMPGMPALGMFPGMRMGSFGMPAGGGGPRGAAPRPLPPPAQPLQHFGSGHSSADAVHLDAAGQQHNEVEPRLSGSGRKRSRSRSRSPRSSGGRRRNQRDGRSRSPRSSGGRRRDRRGSRSRSRSPRRERDAPRPGSGGGGQGPEMPLWLPPLVNAACKSVAFDQGLPFPAIRLLPVLDQLRGERDCVYRAGCNLRHLCDFLQFTRTASVELRPDGPLITRIAVVRHGGLRLRGSRPSATADPTAAATAAAEQGVEGLSRTDLMRTLRLRGLSTEGSGAELQQRLAAYLSDPSSFPEARCQTAPATELGGRLFASQAALRSHIQLLLGVLLGEDIREGHPDFAFLLALLQRHPRYAEKVHAPVEAFRVQLVEDSADLHPLRFFEFLDARGQWDDFSYRKCLGMRADHNSELSFLDAMRYAITDQLNAFRMASTKTGTRGQQVHLCDCCGKRVRDGRQLRVIHSNPSFRQVVRDFVASTSLAPPPVNGRVPNSKRRCFTDEAWLAEWRAFHRKNVRLLQLACAKCAQARKVADAEAETAGQQAGQPAEQQWQAWTVRRQEAAGRQDAAPAEQGERRQEPRPDGQQELRQEGQQVPRQSVARSQPQLQEGRRPLRAAEPGWQQAQQGQQAQRLPQQRVEGRGQRRTPGPRVEQQETGLEQRRLPPSPPAQQQPVEARGQSRTPGSQVEPRAGERRQGPADTPMERPAQDRELWRSPSPPPRERQAPQQWQAQLQQDDWLTGLSGWQQQVAAEAKQWEDWGQQSATVQAQPQVTARAQPSRPSTVPRRAAPPAQQQPGNEQQAQMAARAARQQEVVQRTAQQRAARPAAGPARLSGEQQQAQQAQQQAAAQPAALPNAALAPDAFSSAETDAWLSGSP